MPHSIRRLASRRQLLFAAPAAVFLTIFAIYPLLQLMRMSVSDVTVSTLNDPWQYSGLENFQTDFASPAFGETVLNTVIFVTIVTLLGLAGGLGAAILLSKSGRWTGFILGLLVFIWALPPVVNGSVWKFLLGSSGLFNSIGLETGLTTQPIPFLFDDSIALYSVALVNAWAVIPFNALVFRASIMGISPEVFEAARMDGASRWEEIRHIIVPVVKPTTLVLLVLTVVYGFRSFDFIYVMTFGGPGVATTTLPFLGYIQAFVRFDFGLGAATAVIAVAMVIVLAVLYARSVRREEANS
ncbi:carbohydrate ABC transporter permease [Demequina aurantiaca]|uniref:carbohydrate ABC transporter permease n=1 Tax=Demequina aurantiaca TaxID=676200 RepID=UPI000781A298|nr:sugar ABC transporter permease [Demequina aurantiaca]